ncbi:MAG: TerB family tellurite resistance protein [Muribaculaceae bacterium]|nr:TerB family tellurite resistance protein [Muribaculaceae bacterium]MBR0025481.1 TerB family tellurite resistance protein [Muribaculaceae bacterium]
MNFTDQEKIAIVSLLIEMANADGKIAYEEMITFNLMCRRLEIDHNSFVVAHGLKCEHAIEVLKTMSDDKKIELAKLMVELIDSDNQVTDGEIALLNHACRAVGIDQLLQ